MKKLRVFLLVAMLSCANGPSLITPPESDAAPAPIRLLDHCDPAPPEDLAPLDVAIAIDTSISTMDASGFDTDSDGILGELGANNFWPRSTDPGDSLLAAQISGAKDLVSHYADGGIGFSIVAYSGVSPKNPKRRAVDFFVVSPLSHDATALRGALDGLLAYGSKGGLVFSAGMLGALGTLDTEVAPGKPPRKLVLFMSSQAYPSVLSRKGSRAHADPRMQEAARDATDASVRFYTFGLGEAASTNEPHTLSQIAGATGGKYQSVPNTSNLACRLAAALSP